jgi:hypothetical protein
MTSAQGPAPRRAALLFEVLVALTIMVAAMGVLGAQLASGLRLTGDMERLTRAAELTDRLLALVELDPQMQELLGLEKQTDGEFGDEYPGWFWQIAFEPVQNTTLTQVQVGIWYDSEDPARASIQNAKLIRQVTLLKAPPGRIDLARDFGADPNQIEQFQASLPTGDFDPTNINPQDLVRLISENPELIAQLLAMAPGLQSLLQGATGVGDLANLAGLGGSGDLAGQLSELAGQLDQGGVDSGQLGNLMQGAGAGAAVGGARQGTRGGASGMAGAGRPPGAQPRGGTGRPATGQPPAANPGTGQEHQYTIEDLLRMRDEMQKQGGG